MRLHCFECGKIISSELPDASVVRAVLLCPECFAEENAMGDERMLKWFEFSHLPEKLQAISKPFGVLATEMCAVVMPGPERTVSLRKLLEAKDAAVRAALNPGC